MEGCLTEVIIFNDTRMNTVHTDQKNSRDTEDDEDDVSSSPCDESSEYSEDDDEIKEEIDPWATLIEDAKVIVRSKYEELLNAFQMNGQDKNIAKQKPLKKFYLIFKRNSLTFTWIIYAGLKHLKRILCIERSCKRRKH